jgi:acetoin utilization protein AcuC
MNARPQTCVVAGEAIARYGFGEGHPFGTDRHDVFLRELRDSGVADRVSILAPREASREELESFHQASYLDLVRVRSQSGDGFLDAGDTPAFRGVYETTARVVGATLVATEAIMDGRFRNAFVPIAGLHHAARGKAAGFCVFNDAGVVIEQLRCRFGLRRIAYVDIDAHHGDGVYYAFEDDPDLLFADIHEDGRYLYPGTGAAAETGTGPALGTKLNLPLAPGAGDGEFMAAWAEIESYLRQGRPEFVILQCGADSLADDPITHLRFTEGAHGHAARRLVELSAELCGGRLLAVGGGGYNRRNIARAWTRVVDSLATA